MFALVIAVIFILYFWLCSFCWWTSNPVSQNLEFSSHFCSPWIVTVYWLIWWTAWRQDPYRQDPNRKQSIKLEFNWRKMNRVYFRGVGWVSHSNKEWGRIKGRATVGNCNRPVTWRTGQRRTTRIEQKLEPQQGAARQEQWPQAEEMARPGWTMRKTGNKHPNLSPVPQSPPGDFLNAPSLRET